MIHTKDGSWRVNSATGVAFGWRHTHGSLKMRREFDETTIDDAIAKCQRIQDLAHGIDKAFTDMIEIFKQAAADCGYSESESEDGNDGN